MKNISLLCLLFVLSFASHAQDPIQTTFENGKSELVLVVPATGTSDELFLRAKDWLYRTYNSGKTVEQYEDKAAGRLVGHAQTSVLPWKVGLGIVNDGGNFKYALTIDVKEGKARLTINDLYFQRGISKNAMILQSGANLAEDYPFNWPTSFKKAYTSHWQEMQLTTKAELSLLAQSFQRAMTTPVKASDF